VLRRASLVFVAFAIASSVFVTTSSPAHAQSQHIEASIRASQARAALRRGDLEEAVRLFRESLALDNSPRVIRELAELLERRGEMRAAAEQWSRYAAVAPDVAAREDAIRRSDSLRRLPSLLRVRVSPVIAGREARVWFDHDTPRAIPAGGAVSTVEGGSHRVRVEAPGYRPFETMVTTGYGEPAEVVARMSPVAPDSAPSSPAP
jgi:hypothetical protein